MWAKSTNAGEAAKSRPFSIFQKGKALLKAHLPTFPGADTKGAHRSQAFAQDRGR